MQIELIQEKFTVLAGFVQVPETALPNGLVIPAFQVAQHISTKSSDGVVSFDPTLTPWTNITFYDAKKACSASGYGMITETQWLSIAYNLSQQDCNWTGGKVGKGNLFQGIRNGGSAKPGHYVSCDTSERRWMTLSNGTKICDFNGNVFQWVFDDVQGDEKGLIAKEFAKDSASLTTAPYPSEKKGMGYRPVAGADWSSVALVRGGCWYSNDNAGVFDLGVCHPVFELGNVGFRCTLP